ncbi:MAG: hypothetical protein KJO66_06775 [Gammaproteobacteria bacterium]|nr:hypothetical protein [Gammaproteobacteria bacterium]
MTDKTAKKPVRKPVVRKRASAAKSPSGQVFPIDGGNAVKRPVRRQPIDLEQLQQRIEVIERRLRDRAPTENNQIPNKDLDHLKQRMKVLERSVHSELWQAKQREHTLLEMLARPTLRHAMRDRAIKIRTQTLPATGRWCVAAGREWWIDNQPDWWPRFARAWEESLDRARGIQRG